jgi:hypothetical protein
MYCVFDVQKLVLCLTRDFIKFLDYKIMLSKQWKITFNFVLVGKNLIKIEQELTGIMI